MLDDPTGVRRLWAKIHAKLGKDATDLSAMNKHHLHPHGPSLIDVMEQRGKRFKTILEIGTAHAASAVVLSHFADKVITIDVKRHRQVGPLLEAAGESVRDRITLIIVRDNAAKKDIVDRLDFDLAFIDGDHHAPEFKIDFDLCKRCGLLLCHDYPTWRKDTEGPGAILNTQTEGCLEPYPPFVWWTRH